MNAIELSGWQDGKRVTLPTDEELYLELLNEKRKTSRLKCGIERAAASTEGSY